MTDPDITRIEVIAAVAVVFKYFAEIRDEPWWRPWVRYGVIAGAMEIIDIVIGAAPSWWTP